MVDGAFGAGCFEALEETVAEKGDGVLVWVRRYLRSVSIVVRVMGALLEHLDCVVLVMLMMMGRWEVDVPE